MDKKIEEIIDGITVSPGLMQDLYLLSNSLSIAVDKGFMKREHAGAVWKRILTISGVDTTKKEVKEEDAIT